MTIVERYCLCGSKLSLCLIEYSLGLQLLEKITKEGWKYPSNTEWWSSLKEKMAANAETSKVSGNPIHYRPSHHSEYG